MAFLQNSPPRSRMLDDRWSSDSEDEELQNETPLNGVDPEFRNKLVAIKHNLYDKFVYSPDETSDKSQDINILRDYLNHLNNFYVLTIHAQDGQVIEDSINTFPLDMQKDIREIVEWIRLYFENNGREDTLPYSRLMVQVLHEDPFVQK